MFLNGAKAEGRIKVTLTQLLGLIGRYMTSNKENIKHKHHIAKNTNNAACFLVPT